MTIQGKQAPSTAYSKAIASAWLPEAVREIKRFGEERQIAIHLSRNETALCCEDAAPKRVRQGIRGIPLQDEMKSLLCRRTSAEGCVGMVALHLRGGSRVDFSRVRKLLLLKKDEDVCFATETDLRRLKMRFGTVNPVHLELRSGGKLLQLFDSALLAPDYAGHTMMTNAGDLTWGMAFCASELMDAIRTHRVASFSKKGI